MMKAITDGESVDYVIVYSLSRFGRNADDVSHSMHVLQDYSVYLHFIKDKLDSDGPMGLMMIDVAAAFAEMERENIRETTRAGRYQKARMGLWNGAQAPFGYRIQRGGDGILKIDEEEAKVVRLIFDRYVAEDGGVNGIATWLQEEAEGERQVHVLLPYEREADYRQSRLHGMGKVLGQSVI